ncbi:MAG TPA: hypothetical protein VIM11_15020 [Tepidisphaeraceae bacterium]
MEIRKMTIRAHDGQACDLTISKTGKVTWKAIGDFDGCTIESEGARNPEDAAEKWKYKVKCRYDA